MDREAADIEALGREVASGLGSPGPDGPRAERQMARVTNAWEQARPTWGEPVVGRTRWIQWSLVGAGLLVILVALIARFSPSSPVVEPLAVPASTDGEESAASGRRYVQAGSEPVKTLLSSRSWVEASPRSSFSVSDETSEIDLERGELDLSVDPNELQSWVVLAGPIRVRVVGTRFSVRHTPDSTVEVHVRVGTVHVTGSEVSKRLRSGQRYVLDLEKTDDGRRRSQRAEDLEAQPDRVPSRESMEAGQRRGQPNRPSNSGSMERARSAPAPSAPPPVGTPKPAGSWLSDARAGLYDSAFRRASEIGLRRLAGRAPPEELALLADSARLSGHPGAAKFVLQNLRRRFPRSTRAQQAAFHLGVMAQEVTQNLEEARVWFVRYVSQRLDSSLRQEALGRLVEVLLRQDRLEKAKSRARQYLNEFPDGPRAPDFRPLVGP
ncbi:MAG: FecR domain-containing protein [Myxococcota bacterium]